jgi:hypothetical protein
VGLSNIMVWRACNLTSFSPCLTGPVDYLFTSRHKGPRFKSPGGYLCETGILLLALSCYNGTEVLPVNSWFVHCLQSHGYLPYAHTHMTPTFTLTLPPYPLFYTHTHSMHTHDQLLHLKYLSRTVGYLASPLIIPFGRTLCGGQKE